MADRRNWDIKPYLRDLRDPPSLEEANKRRHEDYLRQLDAEESSPSVVIESALPPQSPPETPEETVKRLVPPQNPAEWREYARKLLEEHPEMVTVPEPYDPE